jgi:hypothetical protein
MPKNKVLIAIWVLAITQSGRVPVRAADADAPLLDACSLLSSAEISAVLKMPIDVGIRADSGHEGDDSYSSSCIWTIANGKPPLLDPSAPLGGKRFVILNAMRWPAGSTGARSYLEAFREAARKGDIEHTPQPKRFGDEALWWGDGLAVRQGNVGFGISVFLAEKSDLPETFEESLASLVLRHLTAAPDSGARRH